MVVFVTQLRYFLSENVFSILSVISRNYKKIFALIVLVIKSVVLGENSKGDSTSEKAQNAEEDSEDKNENYTNPMRDSAEKSGEIF
jgi:uncharacterized membrane-anchored protein YhcB (DUF1043 family)